MLADQVMGGEETLCLPRRLESLQLSFSSSRRLGRVFGSIVEIEALPALGGDIKDLPDLGHRAPEIVLDTAAPDEHLVQVPLVPRPAHPRHHRLLI